MYTETNTSMPIGYIDTMCHLTYISFYVKSLWLQTFRRNRQTMATDSDTIFFPFLWYDMVWCGMIWYVKTSVWYFYAKIKHIWYDLVWYTMEFKVMFFLSRKRSD